MEIIGLGTDVVLNHRLKKSNKFITKFLSKKEYEIYSSLNYQNRKEFVSGRWAAKEAIVKATNKKYMYSEITILNNSKGKPEVLINNLQTKDIIISISHEKRYTIATAIVVE